VLKLKKEMEEKRKGFAAHLISYIMVCLITFTVDSLTSPGFYWFYWPILGMGISVVIHWFVEFGYYSIFKINN
jgi:hypothetical protein